MKMPERNYETLDAIVVIYSLTMVSGIIMGFFVFGLEPDLTPVVASLGTGILGIPALYGAFRWGTSVGAKKAAEDTAETAKAATGALAQIAGAGPPPPASPLEGAKDGTTDSTAGTGVGPGEDTGSASKPWPWGEDSVG